MYSGTELGDYKAKQSNELRRLCQSLLDPIPPVASPGNSNITKGFVQEASLREQSGDHRSVVVAVKQ